MTAIHPKSSKPVTGGTVYRAKVTGRHAITLPAELCRQLGIEVGDYVQLESGGDAAILRPVEDVPITAIRDVMKKYYPDTAENQKFLQEERSGWNDREALFDQLQEDAWEKRSPSGS